jgi:hypothetical protein
VGGVSCFRYVKPESGGLACQCRDGDLSGGHECHRRYFMVTIRRCYKPQNMKVSVRCFLFEYKGLELVILSKPFKTKHLAEKAGLKYPDRIARKIGIGVVQARGGPYRGINGN